MKIQGTIPLQLFLPIKKEKASCRISNLNMKKVKMEIDLKQLLISQSNAAKKGIPDHTGIPFFIGRVTFAP